MCQQPFNVLAFKHYSMKNIPVSVWIKFGIVFILYLLWCIWVGNYWLLLGLPIIVDVYLTKKVPWNFWKKTKEGDKPSKVVEWVDAVVFALVAVYFINLFLFQNYKIPTSSLEKSLLVGDHLFVSKVSFGPRIPNTPLAFPLVQNTFPILNCNSYVEWPNWDYRRLAGCGSVERNDIVVFNFPAGDTIAFLQQNPDYYNLCRDAGRYMVATNPSAYAAKQFPNAWERNQYLKEIGKKEIKGNAHIYGQIMYRPVDRRENYVKRCVALPGDSLEVRHNQLYINGTMVNEPAGVQHLYHVFTDGSNLSKEFFTNFGISEADRRDGGAGQHYLLPLTAEKVAQLNKVRTIVQVQMDEQQPDSTGFAVFPYSPDYAWSRDNFGPLWIPKKGATVELNVHNLVLYEAIITSYEGNKLAVKGEQIIINGQPATSYTFKMDYYFMMGDNRHKSADSRYWGFVPEDHVVGKPLLVWLSLDEDKSFPMNIRWNRFFKWVGDGE